MATWHMPTSRVVATWLLKELATQQTQRAGVKFDDVPGEARRGALLVRACRVPGQTSHFREGGRRCTAPRMAKKSSSSTATCTSGTEARATRKTATRKAGSSASTTTTRT